MNNIKKTFCLPVHLNIKNTIFCHLCGKSFSHQYRFEYHMDQHKDFNLKCLHCDKVFNQRIHLMRHLQFHINPRIKPYKCTICGYDNDRKGNVCWHVNKVHKKQWTQKDIHVDKELETRMMDIVKKEADVIMDEVDAKNKRSRKSRSKH